MLKKIKRRLKYLLPGGLRKKLDNLTQVITLMAKRVNTIDNRLRYLETVMTSDITPALTGSSREQKIIVSMTSYPARINDVHFALARLFRQTLKADKIVLWLAEEEFPGKEGDLPDTLLAMKDWGLEIEWCENLMSYKKALPSIKKYPNDLLILVDDDILYDVDLIEKLYIDHIKNPDAIIASRAHRVTFDKNGEIKPYKQWEKQIEPAKCTKDDILFFTTGAGTLIPAGILCEQATDYALAKDLCPAADDIWFNIMANISGAEVAYNGCHRKITSVANTQEVALAVDNVVRNDEAFKKTVSHFKDELKGNYKKALGN